jgi:DNA replication licensing factor MCM2
MIRVSGVVTRRTGVFPQMKAVAYDCGVCSALLGPYRITGVEIRPDSCVGCNARGPFKINQARTEYGNYQRITLQETPGSVPPGRVPRYKEVILLGDLIDVARPGEEVEVTGIYVHSSQTISKRSNGFPVFNTVIEANCVQKRHGSSSTLLSEEDKRKIRELGKDPQVRRPTLSFHCLYYFLMDILVSKIGERIIRSIAPSIYGHRHVKTGVALALFGGCHKDGGSTGMHRVRGDINILLLGNSSL